MKTYLTLILILVTLSELRGDYIAICVDPGHGGYAPGEIGNCSGNPQGKALNMDIADLLAYYVLGSYMSIKQTRYYDYYVPNTDRPAIANGDIPDLYGNWDPSLLGLSIHHDSVVQSGPHGTKTFWSELVHWSK